MRTPDLSFAWPSPVRDGSMQALFRLNNSGKAVA